MTAYAKDAAVWKPTNGKPWVKDAGIWKQPVQGYARDAGIWKPALATPVSVEHFGTVTSSGSAPNFGTISIGEAEENRLIVAILGLQNTSNRTYTGCLIGGIAATSVYAGTGSFPLQSMYSRVMNAGTSATFTATVSGTGSTCSCSVYAIKSLISPDPIWTDYGQAWNSGPRVLTGVAVAGGVIIASGMAYNDTSGFAIAGVDMVGSIVSVGGTGIQQGHRLTADDDGGYSLSFGWGGSNTPHSLLAASFA